MGTYELYLTVHVLAVIVWVGGAVTMQVLAARAGAAGDAARMAAYGQDVEFVSARVFMPASIIVLLSGFALVFDGPWRFEDTWVALGLAGFVVSLLVGMLFLGPESGRVKVLMQERGPKDADVRARIARLSLASRLQTVLLVLIVLDMVVKPGA